MLVGNKPHFEIYLEKKGLDEEDQFRWRLRAANGEIIAASEGYHNLKDCKDTIEQVRQYARYAGLSEEFHKKKP
jgi:hypothetical protein